MINYEGKKIRLRPLKRSDIDRSILWKNDPETRENSLGYRFPVTEKMEENWFSSALDDQSRNRVVFAIETLDKKRLIGFIHLNRIDWISRTCYFGITIGEKDCQGRRMGSDAMEILFRYAFTCLNLQKICLELPSFNEIAFNAYKKFGFLEEGVQRKQLYLEDEYHNIILMGLLKHEFYEKYEK